VLGEVCNFAFYFTGAADAAAFSFFLK
jgi:hypothetical protein